MTLITVHCTNRKCLNSFEISIANYELLCNSDSDTCDLCNNGKMVKFNKAINNWWNSFKNEHGEMK